MMYDKDEIETFMGHGEDEIPTYDIIFCTEKGRIIFANQRGGICCEMKYNNGIDIMQYCTDNDNQWTRKIVWITDDYWGALGGVL